MSVYLYLKFIRILWRQTLSNSRLHLFKIVFFSTCLSKHSYSSFPYSYFSYQEFLCFQIWWRSKLPKCVLFIFQYKKIANVSPTTFILIISFLTNFISLIPVQVNCIRLQYLSSMPFADKAKVLQSKPDS